MKRFRKFLLFIHIYQFFYFLSFKFSINKPRTILQYIRLYKKGYLDKWQSDYLIKQVHKKRKRVNDLKHLERLKKIVEHTETGDEDGFSPDLTITEIESIKWAINELEKKY